MQNISERIQECNNAVQNSIGRKRQIELELDRTRQERHVLSRHLLRLEKARKILQTVAQMTQQKLEYHLSEVVSLALDAVFDNPYRLRLRFEQKRGKTEANLLFERDGKSIEPMSASGCGVIDVASFALRVALWSLRRPRTRAVLILDEPFKNLSNDLQERASEMVSLVSERLGIQTIMVTHNQELIKTADRIFHVVKKGDKSKVISNKYSLVPHRPSAARQLL